MKRPGIFGVYQTKSKCCIYSCAERTESSLAIEQFVIAAWNREKELLKELVKKIVQLRSAYDYSCTIRFVRKLTHERNELLTTVIRIFLAHFCPSLNQDLGPCEGPHQLDLRQTSRELRASHFFSWILLRLPIHSIFVFCQETHVRPMSIQMELRRLRDRLYLTSQAHIAEALHHIGG